MVEVILLPLFRGVVGWLGWSEFRLVYEWYGYRNSLPVGLARFLFSFSWSFSWAHSSWQSGECSWFPKRIIHAAPTYSPKKQQSINLSNDLYSVNCQVAPCLKALALGWMALGWMKSKECQNESHFFNSPWKMIRSSEFQIYTLILKSTLLDLSRRSETSLNLSLSFFFLITFS